MHANQYGMPLLPSSFKSKSLLPWLASLWGAQQNTIATITGNNKRMGLHQCLSALLRLCSCAMGKNIYFQTMQTLNNVLGKKKKILLILISCISISEKSETCVSFTCTEKYVLLATWEKELSQNWLDFPAWSISKLIKHSSTHNKQQAHYLFWNLDVQLSICQSLWWAKKKVKGRENEVISTAEGIP